jgi:hypothetical protein
MYTFTFLILFTFTLSLQGNLVRKNLDRTAPVKVVDKESEEDMSTIKFTVLPFVLAFKHFIMDRDE